MAKRHSDEDISEAPAAKVARLDDVPTDSATENMILQQVVPDLIDVVPKEVLEVTYPGGIKVNLGNELTMMQGKIVPTIKWKADTNAYYTVYMGDLDAPSRTHPRCREWQQWLVGNVPGNDVARGDTMTVYAGPMPPHGTGLHRYVFLVYKQNKRTMFYENQLTSFGGYRGFFSIRKFAMKYNLGQPVAGNFFLAKFSA